MGGKMSVVVAPVVCSEDVALILSQLGHGFNVGERIESGRREWGRLRAVLKREQDERGREHRARRQERGTL